MAEWKSSEPKPSGWKKAAEALNISKVNKNNEVKRINEWLAQQKSSNQASSSPEKALEKALQVKITKQGDVDIISSPETTPALEALIAYQQNADNNIARIDERTHEGKLAEVQAQTQTTIADLNLQGIQATASAQQAVGLAQASATETAARESSGATRFAATEGARAAIESQRIASQSQERQIGLKGAQDRLLAVEQGAQERLNIGATGEQQRRTQAQLLAGQERQIGLTGREQRLTAAETGKQERLGIAATGTEQRATQAQLLAGQERQIEMTGAQQRMLAQEQGRQQRETEMQAEMNRRYKEAKDAAQAARAFRA